MHNLKLLTCLALIAAPFVAYGDAISCANVSHYNSDHRYKKGDRAWIRQHDYDVFSCSKVECYQITPSGTGDATWKFEGHCDKDPS